uniref:Ovule protein n=1 Tax=Schistosoma curassoni TaxID=6186 RepID=A0A183KUZ1_9TREM
LKKKIYSGNSTSLNRIRFHTVSTKPNRLTFCANCVEVCTLAISTS